MLFELIFNSRKKAQMDPATIHQRLTLLTGRRTALAADRQRLALPEAEGDPEATARRASLDTAIAAVNHEVQMLSDALPAAEAREAEARAREQAAALAKLRGDYMNLTAAGQEWLATVLPRLPTDAEIDAARTRSRELAKLASALYSSTGDRQFHRAAVDPFDELRGALLERLARIDRVRRIGLPTELAQETPVTTL